MQSTRAKIIEKLNNSPPVTVGELARGLKMTRPNIRYHLKLLMESGDVVIAGTERAIGRGRPTHLYSTTLKAVSSDIDPFIRTLWDELMGDKPSKQRARREQKLAQRLTNGRVYKAPSGPLPQKLNHTVQALNSVGFQSRWEARPEAPIIILERCPYDRVFPNIPELCGVDCLILQEILDGPVEQIAQRQLIAGRGSACIFRLVEES